jgi:hypothetical protein
VFGAQLAAADYQKGLTDLHGSLFSANLRHCRAWQQRGPGAGSGGPCVVGGCSHLLLLAGLEAHGALCIASMDLPGEQLLG